VRIASGGVTDLGRVRTNNEDCYKIVEPLNLFVLSDGMGGEAHGEIASAMAVETVVKHCLDIEANPAAKVIGQNVFRPPSIWPTRIFSSPPKRILISTAWARL